MELQLIAQILGSENVDGKEFSFKVSGDSKIAHTLKVVCIDAAGNMTELEFDGFYVTTNMRISYINNKPLLFGSIAGILVLTGGIVLVIIKRKSVHKELCSHFLMKWKHNSFVVQYLA